MKLQKEQQLILDTKGKDIIVSAGAGSGKTFVMIEKILDSIIKDRISVTNLLVVTFTNAAATEMNQKLERKLREHLLKLDPKSEEYSFVLEQINLLPQSNICTLHKFCQNIIAKYFYVLDMDVGFSIVDEIDSKMLKNKALDDVLFEIEKTEEQPVVNLLYVYDRKRDNVKLKEMIERVYNYLENQPDVECFKNKVISAYLAPLNENPFCEIINKHIVERCEYYKQVFEIFAKSAEIEGFEKLEECAKECSNVATLFLQGKNFEEHLNMLFSEVVGLPKVPRATPEFAELQEEFKVAKSDFADELDYFKEICVSSDAKLLEADLHHNSEVMTGIFEIYERFKNRFEEYKKKRNVVDFGDLEHFCLKILENNDIATEVKNSFAAIYVDEYQDINDVQEKIISIVQSKGNLFLVGDVKQSIYGFRNTNPQIFIDKVKSFATDSEKSSIMLNCNFRSDQKILDFVNLVFSKLMTDSSVGVDYLTTSLMASDQSYAVPNATVCQVELDVIDKSTFQKPEKQEGNTVYSVKDAEMIDILDVDVAQTEGDVIADKILALMNEQKQIFDAKLGEEGEFRNIRYGDISILCQNRNADLSVILQRIRQRGIPVEDFGGENIFDSYEIQVLYNYLRLLNNQHDDVALATLLSSPIINLDDDQLLNIRLQNQASKHFYDCVNNVNDKQISSKINLLNELIEEGRKSLNNGTIFDCLNGFIQKTNFESIVSLLPSGKVRVSNMKTFVNHFVGRSYNQNLFEFINYIENNNNTLELEKTGCASDDIVHVLTMHHSKGLEYPVVFLVNLGHNFNTTNQKDEIVFFDNLGVGLFAYDYQSRIKRNTISRSAIILKMKERALAENLRLLYVAMTRAKNNLFMVGSLDVKKFVPSITTFDLRKCKNFLELILSGTREATRNFKESKHLTVEAIDYRKNVKKHMFDLFVYDVNKKEFKNSEILTNPLKLSDYVPEFEQKVTKMSEFLYKFENSTKIGLKNSVTSLNRLINSDEQTNLKEGAQNFKIDNTKTETNAEVGTIYHKAMQLIDFNLDGEEQIFEFLKDKMTVDELNKIDCGKINACLKWLRPIVSGADEVLREQPFMLYVPYNMVVPGDVTDKVLIQGIIDLVVVKGDEAILIDYKITNIKNGDILRKKYETQLKCYALAIEKSKGKKVKQKILYSFLQEMQIIV